MIRSTMVALDNPTAVVHGRPRGGGEAPTMAHPVEQQPDGPAGTSPPGDVPAARKPEAGDAPAAPQPEAGDAPAPGRQAQPGFELPPALARAVTEHSWPPPSPGTPVAPARPARSRLLPVSIAAVVLVAGSVWWWSRDSAAKDLDQPPPAAGGVATVRITAPETASGSANSGLNGGPVSTEAPTQSAPPTGKAPTGKPTPSKKAAPKASVNSAGSNLALRHNVTASGTEGLPWKASNAVDGDPTTRWGSAWTDTQWIAVDLGARWQISEIKLSWEHAFSMAYKVQVSTDGKSWKSVYSTTNGEGGEVTVDAGKVAARHVRVYSTKRNGQYGISLFELTVR